MLSLFYFKGLADRARGLKWKLSQDPASPRLAAALSTRPSHLAGQGANDYKLWPGAAQSDQHWLNPPRPWEKQPSPTLRAQTGTDGERKHESALSTQLVFCWGQSNHVMLWEIFYTSFDVSFLFNHRRNDSSWISRSDRRRPPCTCVQSPTFLWNGWHLVPYSCTLTQLTGDELL